MFKEKRKKEGVDAYCTATHHLTLKLTNAFQVCNINKQKLYFPLRKLQKNEFWFLFTHPSSPHHLVT